jgi:hypothetical protein
MKLIKESNKYMRELTKDINEYQKTLAAWKESCLINAILRNTGKIITMRTMADFNIEYLQCILGGWEEYTMKGEKLIRFEDRKDENSMWIECITYENT